MLADLSKSMLFYDGFEPLDKDFARTFGADFAAPLVQRWRRGAKLRRNRPSIPGVTWAV
jgi:hypothetical protein